MLCGAICFPTALFASIIRVVPFDEKVANASAIVVGVCSRNEARWDATHHLILTYSTFTVENIFKGTPSPQITIVLPGGELDGIGQFSVGVPTFEVGHAYVLFVRDTRVGPTILYFQQGVYAVTTDAATRERIVAPFLTAAVMIDTQRGMAVTPETMRSLREFERAIRESIRRRDDTKMDMGPSPTRGRRGFWAVLREHWLLLALAVFGAALATWQFLRR